MVAVPTIDLAHVDDTALAALDAACRDHGFFFLKGHGLEHLMPGLKAQAAAFFHGSRANKESVLRQADNPMGYYDRELTKRKRDQKEVFDYYATRSQGGTSRMPWPKEPDGFEEALSTYFLANSDVSRKVMRLLCKALGVREDALDAPFAEKETSSARLNFYPSSDPLPEAERSQVTGLGDMALHHHTDQGAITLLFQDSVGGLQALSDEEGWIDVPPTGDTLVVNIGDIVQVWSNGQYKAAVHRVVPVPEGAERYSMPFFFQPSFDTVVTPLAELGAPNYRSFTWREFIMGRISDNYGDVGEDDIQVERYRIAS